MDNILLLLRETEGLVSKAEKNLQLLDAQTISEDLENQLKSIKKRSKEVTESINDKKKSILGTLMDISTIIEESDYQLKSGVDYYLPLRDSAIYRKENPDAERIHYGLVELSTAFPEEFYELCYLILAKVPKFLEQVIGTEKERKRDHPKLHELVRRISEFSQGLQQAKKAKKK